MKKLASLGVLAFSLTTFAAVTPSTIPRQTPKNFVDDAIFEGGRDVAANLVDIRFGEHRKQGFERWVIDFSDLADKLGAVAPKFQLRYEKAETLPLPEGGDLQRRPARFLFVLRQIQKNRLTEEKMKNVVKKSRFVKEILLYPPIEKGDMAIEFILKENVRFAPHQPSEREGRLVLDIRRPSAGE